MRLYVPATLAQIHDRTGLRPTTAHAVTPALAAALPGEDEEGLELAALLAAADESVALLAGEKDSPRLRVVVVAEVSGERAPVLGTEALPSAVSPPEAIGWDRVVSLHVDEPGAEPDVASAATGDHAALDRAAERDLLWYDVTELAHLRSAHPPRPVA